MTQEELCECLGPRCYAVHLNFASASQIWGGDGISRCGEETPAPPILDLLVTLLRRGQLRDFGKLSPNCVCWASEVWQEAGRDGGFLSWGSRSASGGSMGPFKWEQKFVCNCFLWGFFKVSSDSQKFFSY